MSLRQIFKRVINLTDILCNRKPATISVFPIIDTDKKCLGAAFRVQSPYGACVALLGGYEGDRYMRSDGWSGRGDDFIAMLDNYADAVVGLRFDFRDSGLSIKKRKASDTGYPFDTFSVEISDKLLFTFRACQVFEVAN